MRIINTRFQNLKIIQHKKHGDKRGYLRETFRKNTKCLTLPIIFYDIRKDLN